MRAGVLEFPDNTGTPIFYNLNPTPTTVGGTTYPVTNSVGGPWDPRGIGINTLIQSMWNQYMPLPNVVKGGTAVDQINIQGYDGPLSFPISDDTGVIRIDHDLGSKWHLFSSYRIYKLETPSTVQTDIGGFAPGDTFGTIAATANRPSEPSLLVAGLSRPDHSQPDERFARQLYEKRLAMGRHLGQFEYRSDSRRSRQLWSRAEKLQTR